MINSINFIDGLDGLSTGIALIAALTLGLISLDGHRLAAVHRRAVLRAGGGAARVPALELPPGDDLHRHQRRDVRRLHARRAGDPGHREGRRGAARPGRPDHRHLLDHRPPPGQRPVAVHAGSRPHPPPAAGPRPVPRADGARHLRDLRRARAARRSCCRVPGSCTRSWASPSRSGSRCSCSPATRLSTRSRPRRTRPPTRAGPADPTQRRLLGVPRRGRSDPLALVGEALRRLDE